MRTLIKVSLLCLILSAVAAGQTVGVSQISGTVKDQSGAVLPGVEIKVTQTDTGLTRNTITDERGIYSIPNLQVGPYRLEASLPGFSTYIQTGIVLQVNSNPSVHVVLTVGTVSDSVQVTADASLVEIRNTSVGQVMDNQRVVELPLQGRQVTDLVLLSPAAVVTGGFNGNRNFPTVAISVAGGSGAGTTYRLDGASHNDFHNNLNLPLPFPDAMQEFKLDTGAADARAGRSAAGAVNVVTKTGTNAIHGDAFWYVRNALFNARNPFAAVRDDSLKRNQIGGTLGGPIIKNKLFWFVGYQFTSERSDPRTSTVTLPTRDMLNGDFTTITSVACNPGRTTPVPLLLPFQNNKVDPKSFFPGSVKLASFLPVPTDPCGLYQYGFPSRPNQHDVVAKVDLQKSDKHQMFARHIYAHRINPLPDVDPKTNGLAGTFTGTDNAANSLTLGDTYTVHPSLISSFRLTGTWTGNYRLRPKNFVTPADIGINLFVHNPGDGEFSVTNGFSFGGSGGGKWNMTGIQISEDLDWIRGNHQVGFGGTFTLAIENQYNNQFSNGSVSFGTARAGMGYADFLLGLPSTITQAHGQQDFERGKQYGLYVTDNWKVSPRFSVNAGVRWEPYLPWQHKYGWVNHFEMANFLSGKKSQVYLDAPAGMMFPGDPGFPDKGMHRRNVALFAPRLGLVFDPNGSGKQVVRAGYGLFYDYPPASYNIRVSNSLPYGGQVTLTNPSLPDPWINTPRGNPFPIPLADKNLVFPTQGTYYSQPFDLPNSYTQQWNLSVQRQFGNDWSVDLSYLGNHASHIWADRQANPVIYIPGASTTAAANIQSRRLLTLINPTVGAYYNSIIETVPGGNISYNGMVVKVQKRFSGQFTIQSNYTLGHCISDMDPDQFLDGQDYINWNNRRQDRGNCSQDRRHLTNNSVIVSTPNFGSPTMRKIVGGWQLSTIYRLQSGTPLTVTTTGDAGLLSSAQRPDRIASGAIDNPTIAKWFDTSAFIQNSPGSYGNSGRNILHGPKNVQLDMSLTRRFQWEGRRIEFRAEAFNAFNMFRPNNPNTALTNNNFGRITSAQDARIMQFAMKYVF